MALLAVGITGMLRAPTAVVKPSQIHPLRGAARAGLALAMIAGMAHSAAAQETPALVQPAPTEPAPRAAARFTDRPVQLELLMGVGTTVGELGFAGDINVKDWLALGAGIGGGVFGPVWELHARTRPAISVSNGGRTLQALTLEAAFSRGKYAEFDNPLDVAGLLSECGASDRDVRSRCYRPEALPHQTSFAQFELGWEARFSSRYTLRASAGAASALYIATPQDCTSGGAPAPCAGREPARTILVASLAAGLAF